MMRDVAAGRVPVIFRGELSAKPVFAGALIATIVHRNGLATWWYVLAGRVCLIWRLLALKCGWFAPLPPGLDRG